MPRKRRKQSKTKTDKLDERIGEALDEALPYVATLYPKEDWPDLDIFDVMPVMTKLWEVLDEARGALYDRDYVDQEGVDLHSEIVLRAALEVAGGDPAKLHEVNSAEVFQVVNTPAFRRDRAAPKTLLPNQEGRRIRDLIDRQFPISRSMVRHIIAKRGKIGPPKSWKERLPDSSGAGRLH